MGTPHLSKTIIGCESMTSDYKKLKGNIYIGDFGLWCPKRIEVLEFGNSVLHTLASR
jgi:hypothetical protein